jgi:hypothetical protein
MAADAQPRTGPVFFVMIHNCDKARVGKGLKRPLYTDRRDSQGKAKVIRGMQHCLPSHLGFQRHA